MAVQRGSVPFFVADVLGQLLVLAGRMHVFSRGVGRWKRVGVRCPALRRTLLVVGVVILVSSGLRTVLAIVLRRARVRRASISIYCTVEGEGGWRSTVRAKRVQNAGSSGFAPGCNTAVTIMLSCSLVHPKLCLLAEGRGAAISSSCMMSCAVGVSFDRAVPLAASTWSMMFCRSLRTLTHRFRHDCHVCCGCCCQYSSH